MTTLAEAIGARVREARQARGLTQERLAFALEPHGVAISGSRVSLVEHGRSELRPTELVAVARVLGVHPATLLGFDEPDPVVDDAEAHAAEVAVRAAEHEARVAALRARLHAAEREAAAYYVGKVERAQAILGTVTERHAALVRACDDLAGELARLTGEHPPAPRLAGFGRS